MSAAEELRRAAEVLRGRVGAATPGPWLVATDGQSIMSEGPGVGGMVIVSDPSTDEPDAAYIATVHPGVGLLLAGILSRFAETWTHERCHSPVGPDEPCGACDICNRYWLQSDAINIARLINRDQS